MPPSSNSKTIDELASVILGMLDDGKSYQAVADALNIGRGSVWRIKKDAGRVRAHRPWKRIPAKTKAAIRKALKAGGTDRQVAEQFGVGVVSVWRIRTLAGLESNVECNSPVVKNPAKFLRDLRRLHGEGLTDPQISKRLKVNKCTVGNYRRGLGLGANGSWNDPGARAAAIKTWRENTGVENLRGLYDQVLEVEAARLGWPGRSLAQAEILFLVKTFGPMTESEMIAAIPVLRVEYPKGRKKRKLSQLTVHRRILELKKDNWLSDTGGGRYGLSSEAEKVHIERSRRLYETEKSRRKRDRPPAVPGDHWKSVESITLHKDPGV